MIYRNIKTGAEIITSSVIKAPSWVLVPDKRKEAPKAEPLIHKAKAEPVTEPVETAPVEAEKEETKQTAKATKSAPKKATKKRGSRK